jgi:hypothetical protein
MSTRNTALFFLLGRIIFSLVLYYGLRLPPAAGNAKAIHIATITFAILGAGITLGLKARFCAVLIAGITAILAIGTTSLWLLILFSGALFLSCFGSGAYSLDRFIGRVVGQWLDAFFRVRYTDILK